MESHLKEKEIILAIYSKIVQSLTFFFFVGSCYSKLIESNYAFRD